MLHWTQPDILVNKRCLMPFAEPSDMCCCCCCCTLVVVVVVWSVVVSGVRFCTEHNITSHMVVVKLHSHLIICHCCSPILRQLFLLNMPLLPEPSASPGFYTPSLVWSVWQCFCCLAVLLLSGLVWSAPLPSHMNGPPHELLQSELRNL